MTEIATDDVVVLSHHLTPIVTGKVVNSRTRRVSLRTTVRQHKVEWSTKEQDGIRLPTWVDDDRLVVIPDVSEAGRESRTVASVVVEEIASAFENGDMDDTELTREGIAEAIRERFLLR